MPSRRRTRFVSKSSRGGARSAYRPATDRISLRRHHLLRPPLPEQGAQRGRLQWLRGRDGHGEQGAAVRIGIDGNAVVEHARQPLDDRETQPQPARDPRALLEAVEFLEDLAALERRDADTGVVDADLERGAVA